MNLRCSNVLKSLLIFALSFIKIFYKQKIQVAEIQEQVSEIQNHQEKQVQAIQDRQNHNQEKQVQEIQDHQQEKQVSEIQDDYQSESQDEEDIHVNDPVETSKKHGPDSDIIDLTRRTKKVTSKYFIKYNCNILRN